MAKKITVKSKCPRCGAEMVWGSWCYGDEPNIQFEIPLCTNNKCAEAVGYGSEIKFRFINHRTVKIEGLYE